MRARFPSPISTLDARRFLRATLAFVTFVCILAYATRRASALDPHAPLSHFANQTWRTENGLPQNSVHAVLQTRDGFLWFATEGGLARFDGYGFTNFDKESSPPLPNNDVRCLLEDHLGTLWIGTASGLIRWQHGDATTFTTADGLPADTIQSLYEGRDGTLWVLTSDGLARGRDQKFHPFSHADGLPSDRIVAVTETSNGNIWVATRAALARVQGSRADQIALPAASATLKAVSSITALAAGENDSLLVATQDGVTRYNQGAWSNLASKSQLVGPVERLLENNSGVWAATKSKVSLIQAGKVTTFTAANGLLGNRVATIFTDREGATWIGTNGGLARYSAGRMSALATRTSIVSIFEDREGDLWTGTESDGVDILRDQLFSMFSTQQGLSSDSTSSVLQAADGSVWAGTNGGLNRLDGNKITSYTTATGMVSDIVLALAAGPAGNLWAGTPDGLMRFAHGKFTTYTSADGLPDDFARSLLAAQDGSLWIGTRRGLAHLQHGSFATLTRNDGLGGDLIGAMLQDRDGDLWVATFGGLSRIHDGHIENFTTRDGLSSNVITSLHQDSSGTVWIGTNGQGLCRWNGKHFFSFARDAALPRRIFAMLEDAGGNLWLSSDQGIFRVALNDLRQFEAGKSQSIPVSTYGTADGMRTREAAGGGRPAAWRMIDGQLWFATLKGLAIVDPQHMPHNTLPPPVVIERIMVDDQAVSQDEMADVPPGRSRFAFEYAGLSFAAPQKLHYRYMLQGFDRGWTDAGVRRIAYYTNLPPGRYRFRVQAAKETGVWPATGASVRFRLHPHFYRTIWFAVVLIVLLALIIFLLYRLRVLRLQRQFDAVIAERARLAREIHDTLAQGFVAVSVQLELLSQLLSVSSLDSARHQLDRARGLVREGLADARRSIWDLRSDGKDGETLPSRLTRTVQQIAARATIAPHVEITGPYMPLAASVEGELLRITQEAVTNVARHSGAANVNVRLLYDPKRVLLEIADDGCGFDPAQTQSKTQGHFGLTGIRERAQQINGQVTIESMPGKGTQVRVEAPVPSEWRSNS